MSDLTITPPATIELALANPVPVNLTLARGVPGPKGNTGEKGDQGSTGSSGLSAYQVAVAGGFVGTEAQWLASLVGEQGPQGEPGQDGADSTVPGPKGDPGEPGQDGASAYAVALANGFVGTEAQWLASLVGEQGPQGEPGQDGADSTVPGPKGDPGEPGQDGSDASVTSANITSALGYTPDNPSASRNPTAHKASHAIGGSDLITPSDIGAATISQSIAVNMVLN